MIDTGAVVAAILLGAAFVVAGASKLAAGSAWRAQAAGLGAPAWSVGPLPWVELVLGAVLISNLVRRPAAIVALVLLLAFSSLLVARLREGRHPPCACFGALVGATARAGPSRAQRRARRCWRSSPRVA